MTRVGTTKKLSQLTESGGRWANTHVPRQHELAGKMNRLGWSSEELDSLLNCTDLPLTINKLFEFLES